MPRPKEFEPDAALDKAMHLFWEKGYAGTSIQDLVDRMGVNRFSIYDTFGDKHALYLAVIARYREQVTGRLLAILGEGDGLSAIQNHFRALAEVLSSPMGRVGCLVQNATLEMAPHDAEVAARTRAANGAVADALFDALTRALGAGADLRRRAHYLFALSQGLIAMAKGSDDGEAVRGAARFVIDEIEGWRRA